MTGTKAQLEASQMEQLHRPEQVSRVLQVSLATLARWRQNGQGPAYLKLEGGKQNVVRYRQADVTAFLDANRRSRTHAGGAPGEPPTPTGEHSFTSRRPR